MPKESPLKRVVVWLWANVPLPEALRTPIRWLLNAKFVIGCSCVVFDDQGRVLLVRHTYKMRPWGLPGGGMRGNESPEEAVLRELREEAAVEGKIERLLGIRQNKQQRLLDIYYLCSGVEQEFVPNAETVGRAWFPLDALPEDMSARQRGLILRVDQLLHQEASESRLPLPLPRQETDIRD